MSADRSSDIQRDEIENGLQFLGFMIMQNKLKPVTQAVIRELQGAKIRTVMATGDNVLTAIHVGRECGIIESTADVLFGDVIQVGDNERIIWR